MSVDFLKKLNLKSILVGVVLVLIVVAAFWVYANEKGGFSNIFGASNQELAEKAIKYINDNRLSSEEATLGEVSEESGLVKIKIVIGANEFDSYVTKDGRFLFPQYFDMSGAEEKTDDTTSGTTASATVEKSDSPMLEAYVVARCPYGLQMQRAMAQAVKELPALANYIKVRYMGSVSGNTITSMHGDAEAQENLRQICIREEQPAKYWDYVSCQMKATGTETACEKSTGVDSAKLQACISDTSRGVAYAAEDFALNDTYNITGSPTLVLGKAVIDETDFGGRSANGVKSALCSGFNTEASFCSTELTTTSAAVSFSEDYSGSGSNSSASCE